MAQAAKYQVKITLLKRGVMRYYSQLDISRLLERAARRARLPVYFTKGFTPRMKMSFSAALKLGVEGSITVTFYLTRQISPQFLRERLVPQLPEGLEIT